MERGNHTGIWLLPQPLAPLFSSPFFTSVFFPGSATSLPMFSPQATSLHQTQHFKLLHLSLLYPNVLKRPQRWIYTKKILHSLTTHYDKLLEAVETSLTTVLKHQTPLVNHPAFIAEQVHDTFTRSNLAFLNDETATLTLRYHLGEASSSHVQ